MFDTCLVCNILKDYVRVNIRKFIIYPFGENGINIKHILKEYFGLEPYYIVDSESSRYNDGVIDSKTLKSVYQSDMYIILTIENSNVNKVIMRELLEYVSDTQIINLHNTILMSRTNDIDNGRRESNGKGFRLSDFLPMSRNMGLTQAKSEKIKVRISHRHPTCWNAISTIYKAFKEDFRFDILLIISNRVEKITKATAEQIRGLGYKYVIWSEYRVEEDRPDIMILTSAYDSESVGGSNCRRYSKLIIMASLFLVHYQDSLKQYWRWQEELLGGCYPDYYLYDSLLYQQIKCSDFFSEKIIEMGNAKFDEIYQAAAYKKDNSGMWQKLKGKTTILWATSHGIWDKELIFNLTFDLYAGFIFQYAAEHQEMGFIFRPHGSFIDEMLSCRFWSKNDILRLKRYCDETSNVVFDDTDSYEIAYSIADGILTDAYCGVVCSSLPMLKPICATYRSNGDVICCLKELLKSCYSAYESKDIIAFFTMLCNKQDPMFEQRRVASQKNIKNFDGKNGWRIKEFIGEKYFNLIQSKE